MLYRNFVRIRASGARWALLMALAGLVSCGPPPLARDAADCPAWVCPGATPTPADPDWHHGVGSGADRDAAYLAAINALARSICIEVGGIDTRDVRELVDNGSTDIQEEWRRGERAAWQQEIRGQALASPYWRAPDGRFWAHVRVSKKSVLTRRIESAVAAMAPRFEKNQRVLVLPAFESGGYTHDLGLLVADRVSAALLEHGQIVAKISRPQAAGGLGPLLKQHRADVLVYGTMRSGGATLSLTLDAVRPPALAEQVASTVVEFPADSYVAVLRTSHPTPVPDFLKAILMRPLEGDVRVEADVQPQQPIDGDAMRLGVTASHDGYLTVLKVHPDGGVSRILPLDGAGPVPIAAGRRLEIPRDVAPEGSGPLLAEMPRIPGAERLRIVVTARPDTIPPARFPLSVSGRVADRRTHEAMIEALGALSASAERWGSTTLYFRVRPAEAR